MKQLIFTLLGLFPLMLWGANPSFNSFNTNQFLGTNSQVVIRDGVKLTNNVPHLAYDVFGVMGHSRNLQETPGWTTLITNYITYRLLTNYSEVASEALFVQQNFLTKMNPNKSTNGTSVLVINTGGNDFAFDDPDPTETISNTVHMAITNGWLVVLCTDPEYRSSATDETERTGIRDMNFKLRRVALTYTNKCKLADFARRLGPDYYPDGSHPDLVGQWIMAATVFEALSAPVRTITDYNRWTPSDIPALGLAGTNNVNGASNALYGVTRNGATVTNIQGSNVVGTLSVSNVISSTVYASDLVLTNPIGVSVGGTGRTNLTADKLLGGNGTNPVAEITVGSGLSLAGGTLTATGAAGGTNMQSLSLAWVTNSYVGETNVVIDFRRGNNHYVPLTNNAEIVLSNAYGGMNVNLLFVQDQQGASNTVHTIFNMKGSATCGLHTNAYDGAGITENIWPTNAGDIIYMSGITFGTNLLLNIMDTNKTIWLPADIVVLDSDTNTVLLPLAAFVANTLTNITNTTIYFTNLSTGGTNAKSWYWNFSNNVDVAVFTSADENPNFTFTNAGDYGIILVASNAWGTNLIWKTNYIKITNGLAGGSYLLQENFEGSNSGYDLADWTLRNTPDPDHVTTDLGLEGTNCLYIKADDGTTHSFTAQSEVWVYGLLRITNGGSDENVVRLQDSGGTAVAVMELSLLGGVVRPRIVCGSAGTRIGSATGLLTNTTYHFWMHYTKGNGADAIADIEFSADGTRSGSGDFFAQIAEGTATADAEKLMLYRLEWAVYIDKIRVSSSQIGNSPE